ncbi:hypothetical protein [Plantactinospora sp. WMMB782]|uniref:hypothetical protein n=1 Tax=Plantactinospora sp. WMMB782 TaxID=3404121 RepID=UPI003B956344
MNHSSTARPTPATSTILSGAPGLARTSGRTAGTGGLASLPGNRAGLRAVGN